MTDLLGVCESWGETSTTIRSEDGTVTTIALADIVSGKPVPPRPSRFARLTPDEVEARATAFFVPRETDHIGDWVLRFTGGANARPNSVLPVGDPGTDLDTAIRRTVEFYAERGREAVAQAVVGSPVQIELEARGWTVLRPGEADTEVLLAGTAAVRRALSGVDTTAVAHANRISRGWLTGNENALANYDAVAESLALARASFATIDEDGVQRVHGRVSIERDWGFVADLMVAPNQRRRGFGRTMMAGLTEWAAEGGASVLLLQVAADNEAAQSLYAQLGFERHHAYRHLTRR
ncbi:MAG: GCN5-related N-acetyltransferase [Marmoricola sp.]|nr:GCN5-related N-acetyltransferase [Marmoricola sp.]